MKKFLPIVSIFIMAVVAPSVFAASLDVSKNANFSSGDLNFSGGEKVYVRVESDGSGSSQKVLNIRDNKYNLVSSVELSKSGNQFTASFSALNSQGYFSLEAVIEGDGSTSKSVKTIKVGSPSSANVQVNVRSSVNGTKTTNTSTSQDANQSPNEKPENQGAGSAVSPTSEVYRGDNNSAALEKPQEHFWLFTFFRNIFFFFWPFK